MTILGFLFLMFLCVFLTLLAVGYFAVCWMELRREVQASNTALLYHFWYSDND